MIIPPSPISGSAAADRPPAPDAPATVAEVHAEIDRQTRTFAAHTGLRCPDGCGRCCRSPHVETTIADATPLAEALVRAGRAVAVLERLEAQRADPRCVLYEPDVFDPAGARGRCTMYAHRPSVCRLFGFAGRRDADGRPQFTACRVHAETMPEAVAAASAAVRTGAVALPIFADLAGQAWAAAPGRPGQPRPINEALREAIHAAGLAARFAEPAAHTAATTAMNCGDHIGELPGDGDGDGDGATPPTPRVPPRRAA